MVKSDLYLGFELSINDLVGLRCFINLEPDAECWTINKSDPVWEIVGVSCNIDHKNFDLDINIHAILIEGDVDGEEVANVLNEGVDRTRIMFLREQFNNI
jgi:hypothetical protein